MTVIMGGCGDKKETLSEEAVNRQYAIIWTEMQDTTGVWGERLVNWNGMGTIILDLDGDGIKEILPYIEHNWGANWWVWYYKDGMWHEVADTSFIHAHSSEIYTRRDDDKTLPRMFYKKSWTKSVSAVIFDRASGVVTLEPYDYQEFQDLKERGILLYEDVGQDDYDDREYWRRDDTEGIQPRYFYKKPGEDSVEAIVADPETGESVTRPFDFQEFDEIRKQGLLIRTR